MQKKKTKTKKKTKNTRTQKGFTTLFADKKGGNEFASVIDPT